ncbi:MAG TPA: Clp protease ClpP, partial [Thermoclostridium sp.]|nr:Clp protease ClpP [Thermoclostridium sp.]
MKRYYSFYQNAENKTADIYIYGDITSWPWYEDEVSSYTLAKELQELDDNVENINVFINSYGGEVAEGLAIYNALKRHKATVTTYADGFACSIASVIFSAGDKR